MANGADSRSWQLPHPGDVVARNRNLVAALAGLLLGCFALFVYQDSALALPLLVIAGLLVALGIFGPRFAGRITLEWGQGGVDLEVRTGLKPRRSSASALPAAPVPRLAPEALPGLPPGPDPPGELIIVRRTAEPRIESG